MKDVKTILEKYTNHKGVGEIVRENQVMDIFEDLKEMFLGTELAEKVKSMYFKNQVLVIASLSDKATNILENGEAEMIEKINSILQAKIVNRIHLVN